MTNLSEKINEIKKLIEEADYILIGAGAGLSTSAGINYSGEEFKKEFASFIKNIILQIYIHHLFMNLKQKTKNGLILLNT